MPGSFVVLLWYIISISRFLGRLSRVSHYHCQVPSSPFKGVSLSLLVRYIITATFFRCLSSVSNNYCKVPSSYFYGVSYSLPGPSVAFLRCLMIPSRSLLCLYRVSHFHWQFPLLLLPLSFVVSLACLITIARFLRQISRVYHNHRKVPLSFL